MHTNSEPAAQLQTAGTPERLRAAIVVGALGVVFGDIGTSPIYTIQTVFNPSDPHPVPISAGNVYGVVSLVFWSVMIIVTLTYVSLVMHADNHGEGGIMALITLLGRSGSSAGRIRTVMALRKDRYVSSSTPSPLAGHRSPLRAAAGPHRDHGIAHRDLGRRFSHRVGHRTRRSQGHRQRRPAP